MASKPLRLDEDLVETATIVGKVQKRSTAKQIEYWATLGRIAKENPDLPIAFIEDIMEADEERKQGLMTEYKFG